MFTCDHVQATMDGMNSFIPPQSASVETLPEFGDHQTCRKLFSMSRSYLYGLASEGKIRSVSIRKPGALKGRRLFDCASIRNFLTSLEASQ